MGRSKGSKNKPKPELGPDDIIPTDKYATQGAEAFDELKRRAMAGENPFTVARELGYKDLNRVVTRMLKYSEHKDTMEIVKALHDEAKITMGELKEDAFRWMKVCLNGPGIPPAIRERAAEAVLTLLAKHKIPLEEAAQKEDDAQDRKRLAMRYLESSDLDVTAIVKDVAELPALTSGDEEIH